MEKGEQPGADIVVCKPYSVVERLSNSPADAKKVMESSGHAGKARPAWAWPAAALLITGVLVSPFLVVDVPAVLDYPNHLARFYILARPNDPFLSRMYAAHWSVLPNVGIDLIGQTLLRILPVHVAGRILLALSLLAPLIGTVLYARAAFGRWTWWSLGAAVIGFNGIFFLGFMNFLLSMGVALAGAGAWRLLQRRGNCAPTVLVGAVTGLAAYFCHLLGFAFFALMIGAQEADGLLALLRDGRLSWRRSIRVIGLLAAALGPPLALYVITHHSTQRGDVLLWLWRAKLFEWAMPFFTYDRWLTFSTALVVLLVVTSVRRGARRASGVALALVTLAILFVAAPFAAAGGAVLDARLPVMAAFLIFAGLAPQMSLRDGGAIAAVLIAVGVARSAEIAVNWQGRAEDLAELRTILAPVGPGAKVLPAQTDFRDPLHEGHGRVLQGFMRVDDHLAALALIERRAFWPLLFADPAQQPVVVLPPYDRMAATGMTAPLAWRTLAEASSPVAQLRSPYLTDWRGSFDYVLVLGPRPSAESTPRGLSLVRAGVEASLYRVDR